jgi:hypothetical protein
MPSFQGAKLCAAEGAADQSKRHRRFGVDGKRIGAPGATAPPLPAGKLAYHKYLHAVGKTKACSMLRWGAFTAPPMYCLMSSDIGIL